MVSRPNWKGHLKLSLVSCPVALYNATTAADKVAFHLLNKETGHRLKRLLVDSETGDPVSSEDQVRGYEVSKGDFITFEDDELDSVALESTHTIDIDGFVARSDVNDVFLDAPYYLVPNEKIGEEAFAVIRDAMQKRGMAGLARVVLYRRERVVMLEPHGKGIVATTLRFPYEIKNENEFFDPIADNKIPADMLDLAEHIIDSKKRTFDPATFEDRYEKALNELIAAKRKGVSPRQPAAGEQPSNVVDLMEALRRSVAGTAGRDLSKPLAAEAKRRPTSDRKRAAPAPAPRATEAANTAKRKKAV